MRVVGKFCPVCGAEGMTTYLGGYIGTLYRCPRCNYIGPVVIERDVTPPEPSDARTNDDKNEKDQ